VTVSDFDRPIRLEEFMREKQKAGGTKIALCWDDGDGKSEEVRD
jgi:hypothetical protein